MNTTFKLTWQTRTANLEGELHGTVINDRHKQELLTDLSVRGFRATEVAAEEGDSISVPADQGQPGEPNLHVPDGRVALIAALATMPDEAFGWFVLACAPSALPSARAQIWPDGLGGFQEASRKSVEAVRAAASAYLTSLRGEPGPPKETP